MNLSKQRALAVVKYLADRGVKWEKMSYSYYGESVPLVTNDTPEGRKVNRRVEFDLYKMMLVQ
jgi:OOP family OmpA-OmpF porin